MKNINWKVRFNKENKIFIMRTIAAVVIPVLTYLGLKATDLTSWGAVMDVIKEFVSNPYLIGLTVFNALNIIPDPTTNGLGDSRQAFTYVRPRKDDK